MGQNSQFGLSSAGPSRQTMFPGGSAKPAQPSSIPMTGQQYTFANDWLPSASTNYDIGPNGSGNTLSSLQNSSSNLNDYSNFMNSSPSQPPKASGGAYSGLSTPGGRPLQPNNSSPTVAAGQDDGYDFASAEIPFPGFDFLHGISSEGGNDFGVARDEIAAWQDFVGAGVFGSAMNVEEQPFGHLLVPSTGMVEGDDGGGVDMNGQ